jgi:2-beta-glucuronyltransferase
MKRAVLITGHFPHQHRRPSMLWVSDHLQAAGWHMTHITVGYSWLSALFGDVRLRALDAAPHRGTCHHSPTLTSIYSLPPIHPVKTRNATLNRLLETANPLFTNHWRPRLRTPLARADLVICESGPPVLLAPILAKQAPQATRIYRVSDDIRLLNAPDALLRAEQAHQHFTRISTASPHIAARFASHPNVTIDPVGIPHDRIDVRTPDPYPTPRRGPVAVCAGTTLLDIPALTHIARQRSNWQIHVLGRLRSTPPARPNITWHGEQPFATTLAHIAHADIGLAPYRDEPGVEYQTTNSNRILLYRHHGLPTLGPDRLCDPALPSIIGYNSPDALTRCETWSGTAEAVPDWRDLARRLSQNGVTDPSGDTSIPPATTTKPRVNTVPAFASSA